jgi:hypothetical protein
MEIEVVVPDCPNVKPAVDRLWRVLDDLGLRKTTFTMRVIANQAEAERAGFTGSSTILVDGRDPLAELGRPPGLTCRTYQTPDGLAGVPALDQLRQVLQTAAGPGPEQRNVTALPRGQVSG